MQSMAGEARVYHKARMSLNIPVLLLALSVAHCLGMVGLAWSVSCDCDFEALRTLYDDLQRNEAVECLEKCLEDADFDLTNTELRTVIDWLDSDTRMPKDEARFKGLVELLYEPRNATGEGYLLNDFQNVKLRRWAEDVIDEVKQGAITPHSIEPLQQQLAIPLGESRSLNLKVKNSSGDNITSGVKDFRYAIEGSGAGSFDSSKARFKATGLGRLELTVWPAGYDDLKARLTIDVVPPPAPKPVISTLDPAEPYVDDTLRIIGGHFGTTSDRVQVFFGRVSVETVPVADDTIRVRIPILAEGEYRLRVKTSAAVEADTSIWIRIRPAVANFTPSTAYVGPEIGGKTVITGVGFGADCSSISVKVGEDSLKVDTCATDRLVVSVPTDANTGLITVMVGSHPAISGDSLWIVHMSDVEVAVADTVTSGRPVRVTASARDDGGNLISGDRLRFKGKVRPSGAGAFDEMTMEFTGGETGEAELVLWPVDTATDIEYTDLAESRPVQVLPPPPGQPSLVGRYLVAGDWAKIVCRGLQGEVKAVTVHGDSCKFSRGTGDTIDILVPESVGDVSECEVSVSTASGSVKGPSPFPVRFKPTIMSLDPQKAYVSASVPATVTVYATHVDSVVDRNVVYVGSRRVAKKEFVTRDGKIAGLAVTLPAGVESGLVTVDNGVGTDTAQTALTVVRLTRVDWEGPRELAKGRDAKITPFAVDEAEKGVVDTGITYRVQFDPKSTGKGSYDDATGIFTATEEGIVVLNAWPVWRGTEYRDASGTWTIDILEAPPEPPRIVEESVPPAIVAGESIPIKVEGITPPDLPSVTVCGRDAKPVWSEEGLLITVPEGIDAETCVIAVRNISGADSVKRAVAARPAISDFAPKKCLPGWSVKMSGTHMDLVDSVYVGDEAAEFRVVSASSLELTAPGVGNGGRVNVVAVDDASGRSLRSESDDVLDIRWPVQVGLHVLRELLSVADSTGVIVQVSDQDGVMDWVDFDLVWKVSDPAFGAFDSVRMQLHSTRKCGGKAILEVHPKDPVTRREYDLLGCDTVAIRCPEPCIYGYSPDQPERDSTVLFKEFYPPFPDYRVDEVKVRLGDNTLTVTSVCDSGFVVKWKGGISEDSLPLHVETPGGQHRRFMRFVFPLRVDAFMPQEGRVGSSVTLTGYRLNLAVAVEFNHLGQYLVPARIVRQTPETMTVIVPEGATDGRMRVRWRHPTLCKDEEGEECGTFTPKGLGRFRVLSP